jgi:hypothetical protein
MPGKSTKQTILPYHYNPLTMVRTNHEWSQRGLLHPLALASAFPTPPKLHAPRGAPPGAPAGRPALRHWPPVGRCVGGCCGRSGFLEWMCSGRWKYLDLIKMIEDFCRKQNSLYTLAVLHIWKNVENWSTRQIKCIGIVTAKNDRTVRPPGFAFLTYPVNIIYNYSIHTFPEDGTNILPISDWNKQAWIFSKQAGAKRRKLNRQPRCPNYKLSGNESATCCSAGRSDRSGVPGRKYNGKWTGLEPICRADHTICLRLPRKIGQM